MSEELLTVEDLRPKLLAIVERMPDAVNPQEPAGEACWYTDAADPDRHCIVGQLAADGGWEVPAPGALMPASTAAVLYKWPVAESARGWLNRVQRAADGADLITQRARRWGNRKVSAAIKDPS